MRKLIVTEWISLDGVVQSPAYPDEDPSGGFQHGGWHLRYFETASMKWVLDNVTQAGGFLLGRRTYDVFAAYWPKAAQSPAEPMNALPKFVASRTLQSPLTWQNSLLLSEDIAAAVAQRKREDGKYLLAMGSTELVKTLLAHDLVDEFQTIQFLPLQMTFWFQKQEIA
jgi:dihydrofolate reductase